MRIEIMSKNVEITDELRAHLHKRFRPVARQVSELARLEVELHEERNPAIADRQIASATLRLKGSTLHAEEAATEMAGAIKAVGADIRRQVKRHTEIRRHRTASRRFASRLRREIA